MRCSRGTVVVGICSALIVVAGCTSQPSSVVAHGTIDGQTFTVNGHSSCEPHNGKQAIRAATNNNIPENQSSGITAFVSSDSSDVSSAIYITRDGNTFEHSDMHYTAVNEDSKTWRIRGNGGGHSVDITLTCP